MANYHLKPVLIPLQKLSLSYCELCNYIATKQLDLVDHINSKHSPDQTLISDVHIPEQSQVLLVVW